MMNLFKSIFTISTVLISTSAYGWTWCDSDKLPPSVFDHEPVVSYEIIEDPVDSIVPDCLLDGFPAKDLAGCAYSPNINSWPFGDTWTIYIKNDLSPTEKECVLRHEKAHINGWEHEPLDYYSYTSEGPLYRRIGPDPYVKLQ